MDINICMNRRGHWHRLSIVCGMADQCHTMQTFWDRWIERICVCNSIRFYGGIYSERQK